MKKKLPLICLFFLMVMIFVVPKKAAWAEGPPCPHFLVQDGDDADTEPDHVPTTPFQSECRLHRDVIGLVEPLKLESGINLNCQGHKILPSATGQPDNSATTAFDPVFSQPQLAIFLNEAHDITIKNCVIEGGFDFGILAINSKDSEGLINDPEAPGGFRVKIFNNTIKAWYVPIHLMASDNFEIKLNQISYFVRGGEAILVDFSSDRNVIKDNTMIGDLKAVGAPAVPGPTGALSSAGAPGGLTSNQVATVMTGAVFVTQNVGPHSTLFNVVIEGNPPNLYQLALPNIPELNESSTADNLVEGNDISFKMGSFPGASLSRESGIATPSSLRTTVRSNKILNPSGIGVRDGSTTVRLFPEKCTLDSSRHCLTDTDCFIDGIDAIPKGTCTDPLPTLQNVDWSSNGFLVEDNQIEAPFNAGISIAAKNAIVRGNTVIGPLGQGGLGGIVLRGKFALETGTVITRNIVSNVSIALGLDNSFGLPASFFNAQISLNDFTGYTTAVKTTAFNFPSELSVDGKGNYWGFTCGEGGFDPNLVNPLNPNIVDSNPYGESVAEKTEEELLEIESCL